MKLRAYMMNEIKSIRFAFIEFFFRVIREKMTCDLSGREV